MVPRLVCFKQNPPFWGFEADFWVSWVGFVWALLCDWGCVAGGAVLCYGEGSEEWGCCWFRGVVGRGDGEFIGCKEITET